MTHGYHVSVLLQEVVDLLNITSGKRYIDATLGGGGHAEGIIQKGGIVLGIDQDEEALAHVKKNSESRIQSSELKLVSGNFRDIKKIAEENGFNKPSGILFDLGVSSHQLDTKDRGFSIKADGPLDMRMDKALELTARDVVNTYSKEDLIDIFQRYGEEEQAEPVAEAIVTARRIHGIETTGDLVRVIEGIIKRHAKEKDGYSSPGFYGRHPATKIFQAIRIEVNSELESIKEGLQGALELLDKNGRIAVISFHSLEDRISKLTFDSWERKGLGKIITKKPVVAKTEEAGSNPRARSAKLRVFQKTQ